MLRAQQLPPPAPAPQRCESSSSVRSTAPSPPPPRRTDALVLALVSHVAGAVCAAAASAAAATPALQPALGDCADCIGLVGGALNTCPLGAVDSGPLPARHKSGSATPPPPRRAPTGAVSCVSSFNDDQEHFTAPWSYPGERGAAIRRLAAVAGGEVPPLPPLDGEEPLLRRGRVDALDEAAGYVRLVFDAGAESNTDSDASAPTYDAEFVFLPNDEVVNIRVASRSATGDGEKPRVVLSYTRGATLNRNGARALAEQLRKALGWELVPVMSGFDPLWNSNRKLWFERPFALLRGDTTALEPFSEADDGDWVGARDYEDAPPP